VSSTASVRRSSLDRLAPLPEWKNW
jgi:hypothetical protein